MKHAFNWKRPLFYCLLPVFLVLAFVGFPPPFAPPQGLRAAQEQTDMAEEEKEAAGQDA
jgi:hypothetical protein